MLGCVSVAVWTDTCRPQDNTANRVYLTEAARIAAASTTSGAPSHPSPAMSQSPHANATAGVPTSATGRRLSVSDVVGLWRDQNSDAGGRSLFGQLQRINSLSKLWVEELADSPRRAAHHHHSTLPSSMPIADGGLGVSPGGLVPGDEHYDAYAGATAMGLASADASVLPASSLYASPATNGAGGRRDEFAGAGLASGGVSTSVGLAGDATAAGNGGVPSPADFSIGAPGLERTVSNASIDSTTLEVILGADSDSGADGGFSLDLVPDTPRGSPGGQLIRELHSANRGGAGGVSTAAGGAGGGDGAADTAMALPHSAGRRSRRAGSHGSDTAAAPSGDAVGAAPDGGVAILVAPDSSSAEQLAAATLMQRRAALLTGKQRRGKWTQQETAFARCLVDDFKSGTLQVRTANGCC